MPDQLFAARHPGRPRQDNAGRPAPLTKVPIAFTAEELNWLAEQGGHYGSRAEVIRAALRLLHAIGPGTDNPADVAERVLRAVDRAGEIGHFLERSEGLRAIENAWPSPAPAGEVPT